jgi:ferredoxin
MAIIYFLNRKEYYQVRCGIELLKAYQIDHSLPLKFGCCDGKCGVCAIKVIDGEDHLSKMTKQEQTTLKEKNLENPPYRLACQCAILGNIIIKDE